MTTEQSSSQSHLSSDLETLHARMKDRALTLAELKQALKGRGSGMLLILLALPFCFVAIPGYRSLSVLPYACSAFVWRSDVSHGCPASLCIGAYRPPGQPNF
jgi:Exopolysaccharide synthesis, ExoD